MRGGEGNTEGAEENLPVGLHRLRQNREEGLGGGTDDVKEPKSRDGRGEGLEARVGGAAMVGGGDDPGCVIGPPCPLRTGLPEECQGDHPPGVGRGGEEEGDRPCCHG